MKETIGLISGILVVLSVVPYAIRTYEGKIKPNITSWSIWSVLGLALLLTYKSSGAEANIWPAVFGFTNPTLVTLLALRHRHTWEKPTIVDKSCLVVGIMAIVLWFFVHHDKQVVQYALYIAILADLCAAIPTIYLVWRNPEVDRPFAWALFAVGYGLGALAITEHTFANYVLPLYMLCGGLFVSIPLALHRIKTKAPISEWA